MFGPIDKRTAAAIVWDGIRERLPRFLAWGLFVALVLLGAAHLRGWL